MPPLSDATKPRNTDNLVPINPPTQLVAPPNPNPSADPEFTAIALGPVPPIMGTSTDASRQFYRRSVSQVRMPPLPAAASIATGAQAKSIAEEVIAAAGAIYLDMPSIFNVTGSPASLGGGFDVTLAPELANTVFAGPTGASGLVTVDITSSNFGTGTSAATSGSTTGMNDFVFSAFVDPNPNCRSIVPGSGWSAPYEGFIQYSGSPSSDFHFLVQSQLIASPTAITASAGMASCPPSPGPVTDAYAICFAAFTPNPSTSPSVLQSCYGDNSAGGVTTTFATATFPNPTQIGSTILVAWTITNSGTYTLTDSEGNDYTTAIQVINTGDVAASCAVSYAAVITAGVTELTLTSVSSGATSIALFAQEVTNLQGVNTDSSAVPTFRRLVLADLPAGIASPTFATIGGGTNINTLLIGNGGSLSATGTGTIAATTAAAVPFSGVGAGTNANALVIGSGGSLTYSGSGTNNASAIDGVAVSGTPTSGQAIIASSGTAASWQNITATSLLFSGITSATNTAAAMVVGRGATLGASGSGVINATQINGVAITGTPTTGQVPTATSGTAAVWATPSGGGGVSSLNSLTGALTLVAGTGITVTPSGTNITLTATGGSGAAATGTSVWPRLYQPTTSTTGYGGYSIIFKMSGAWLENACSVWRFGISFTGSTATGFTIGGMQVCTTVAGSTTVTSTTAVTIGSNATPTINQAGSFLLFTDNISVAVSAANDYYFMIFFDTGVQIELAGTANASLANAFPPYAAYALSGNQLTAWAATLPSNIQSSDTVIADPQALVYS